MVQNIWSQVVGRVMGEMLIYSLLEDIQDLGFTATVDKNNNFVTVETNQQFITPLIELLRLYPVEKIYCGSYSVMYIYLKKRQARSLITPTPESHRGKL